MAATTKSLATAIACISAIAVLAGCSQDGGIKAKGAAGEGQAPATVTSGATGDSLKGLSADQIAEKAVEATKTATSLRMKGEIDNEGEPVSLDLAMDAKNNCTGRLGIKDGRADLRRLGEVLYMKGDEAFWRASLSRRAVAPDGGNNDTVIELMKNRWIKMPSRAIEDMQGVCDLDEMLADLGKDKARRTGMTLGKDTRIGGVPAVTLVKKKGRETTTAYVAKEGKPYLLKVVKAGGDEPGTIEFSDYDRPVAVKAPPADEVLDLEDLGATMQSGTDTGTGADTESAGPGAASAEPGAGPDADAGTDSGTDAGSGSGTASAESGTGTDSDTAAGTEGPGATDGTKSDDSTGTGTGSGDAETDADADADADNEGTDSGTGTAPYNTGSGTGSDSGADTGSGSGSGEGDGAATP
ncbi:hypothetical protein ACF08N_08905 [Streptomyces sp. NPDC015127]|uniref:hypothetical protein n=1 Tax=Streptomyces sp. NPDC015127 TaxID=3364939 RepID=UPI0036F89E34